MAKWFYKVSDLEAGPVALEELLRLLRDGALDESAPVRREGAAAWAHAWTVPTLAAALERAKRSAAEPQADDPAAAQATSPGSTLMCGAQRCGAQLHRTAVPPASRAMITLNWRRWLGALLGGALAVLFAYLAACRAMRFPPSRLQDGATGDCYFVFFGRCEAWECALCYFDVFCVVATLAWWLGKRIS